MAGAICICAATCAGYAWAALHASARLSDALPTSWEQRDIEVIGVIAELTQRSERGVRFAFEVEQVMTEQAVVPRRIMISWFGKRTGQPQGDIEHDESAIHRYVQAGERWRLVLRLRRPHGSVNPHGFDSERWLIERNLRATGYVRRSIARIDDRVDRPGYLIERARERIRARFERTLGAAEYRGVLAALAIGDQRGIPAAQWEVFTRTGINHLMSISGLHVTMIAGLVFWLVDRCWRRAGRLAERLPGRKAAAVAGLAAAFGYALLAGFSVPTRRTVFMLAVVALVLWCARRSRPSTVLAGALLLVTSLDPWSVLAPGFWLSFGAVALIMSLSSGRLEVQTSWARPARVVAQWSRVQWAISVGMVPIMLALFAQVSLVSPLANAFAIPVISTVVVPIALAAALLPVPALLHLAHAVTSACLGPVEYLSSLSWAVWIQPAPPTWASAIALAGIFWWLMPAGWPARWLGVLTLLPVLLTRPGNIGPGALELTLLDVGHGLAIVARTASRTLLYDTGPAWTRDSDAGARIVVPYLRGEGVRRLDTLVVSHDDIDHSGGAVSILRTLPVDTLLSSLPPGHPAFTYAVQALRCHAGQHWQWDGVVFRMLHPQSGSYAERSTDNERSCVLQIESFGRRALITGDIGVRSEKRLLDADLQAGSATLAAEVLLVPHHGSRSSSSPAFLEAVAPRLGLLAIGYRNRFGHPHREVVERYAGRGVELLRSDAAGAIRLTFSADGIHIRRERIFDRRYWHTPPP